MTRATQLFATRSDWLACLVPIEEIHPLAFSLSGMFDSPTVSTFVGCASSPEFGIATHGNTILEPCFLVHSPESTIETRPVPQRRGAVRYSIDYCLNEFAVGLKPGGSHTDDVLIAGQLGPPTENSASRQIHAMLLRQIHKSFTPIKSYLVGTDALRLLDDGSRLVVSADASPLYDLAR
jgi:hypothetical protein